MGFLNKLRGEAEERDVVGYEGLYTVTSDGRVFSLNYRKSGSKGQLSPTLNSRGYMIVRLWKNGRHKQMFVHRIVAMSFVDNPNGLETVNHIDEDKLNNQSWNLEWMSRGDNQRYSNQKVSDEDAWEIKYGTRFDGMTIRSIGECLGVSHGTVSYIKKGVRLAHITEEYFD